MVERKPIGTVRHFFPKVSVAVIALNKSLKIGDKISIEKGEEKVEQTVESMQIEHKSIRSAKKGQEVALKVNAEVKKGAGVYKS